MNVYECKNCKIRFNSYEVRGKPRVFCSKECKSDFSNIFKNCEECGQSFKTKKCFDRKYCSQKCSNLVSQRKRISDATRVKFNCKFCKKDFELLESKVKVREKIAPITYCSQKCYHKDKERLIPCSWCKKDFSPQRISIKFCSKDCSYEWRKSKTKLNPGSWLENGYRVIYNSDGKGIKEHINVMQDFIGRELDKDEVVHHINEIRTDNRIENLKLMTRGEHSALHRKMELENGKKLF